MSMYPGSNPPPPKGAKKPKPPPNPPKPYCKNCGYVHGAGSWLCPGAY